MKLNVSAQLFPYISISTHLSSLLCFIEPQIIKLLYCLQIVAIISLFQSLWHLLIPLILISGIMLKVVWWRMVHRGNAFRISLLSQGICGSIVILLWGVQAATQSNINGVG